MQTRKKNGNHFSDGFWWFWIKWGMLSLVLSEKVLAPSPSEDDRLTAVTTVQDYMPSAEAQ